MQEEIFWDFACHVYQNTNVEKACLQFQNQNQVDVNILLWSLWLDVQGYIFDCESWELIFSLTVHLREASKRIRLIRRKTPKIFGFIWIRDKLKKAELMAEKKEIEELESLTLKYFELSQSLKRETRSNANTEHCFIFYDLPLQSCEEWLSLFN